MISITKIFRFEAAHAIYKYPGSCEHLHGHSYELHVSVVPNQLQEDFIAGLGIIIDFKELKRLVQDAVINALDLKIMLSRAYLEESKNTFSSKELVAFDFEPTAENLLIFSRNQIRSQLPGHIQLNSLTLYETRDSFAEWSMVK